MLDIFRQLKTSSLVNSIFLAIAVILSLGFSFSSLAQAQGTSSQSTAQQGLSVSPFILERQMEKGQTLNETIEVTNTTNAKTLPVDISVNDFAANGLTGQQTFFSPGEGDQTYALSKWITITNSPKFVLKPEEKTQINFTITAPANAEDGGHYGAVVFSFAGGSGDGSAVSVSQKIAAIILVKVGKANEDGIIAKFGTTNWLSQSSPIDFETRFKNSGNVHVKPRGSIGIYNMFGKKVGTAIVNENANNVLPNSERVFQSSWTDKYAFGYYTAKEELVFGDSGTVVKAQTGFFVIPLKLVGIIALILLIIIFALSFGMRRYNRWFMGRLQEQNSSKPRPKK